MSASSSHPSSADSGSSREPAFACDGFHTARDRKNRRRANQWMIAFTLAYLATALVLRRGSFVAELPWVAWLVSGVAALVALAAVRSYMRYLREADELLRKIQLESLAFGFCAGILLALFAPLVAKLGLPEPGAAAIVVAMSLGCALGAWLGMRRYGGSSVS